MAYASLSVHSRKAKGQIAAVLVNTRGLSVLALSILTIAAYNITM
jgi:hypothetical protein